jgi:hypothetical protein
MFIEDYLASRPVKNDIAQTTDNVVMLSGGVLYNTAPIDLTQEGWVVYSDSTYTSASPLTIASARTKLTCDGLGAGTNKIYVPEGVTDFWDTTTNKVTPQNIGDAYDFRVQFKGKCSTVSAYFDFELDVGAPLNDIFRRTLSASKGANAEISYSLGVPLFSLDTFIANGGDLYLNTIDDGTTLTVYDIQIFIKRDYASL